MRRTQIQYRIAVIACPLLLAAGLSSARAASGWTPPPSWSPADVELVRAEVVALLSQAESTPERDKLVAQWQGLADTAPPEIVLEHVAATAAAMHEQAATLVETCRQSFSGTALPDVSWLQDSDLAEFFTDNLRLYAARWLMQEGYYNESLDLVADLTPDDVVAPATLLFCKAVCHHQLVEVKPATASAQQLLERADELPTRYEQLATLISEDIKAVEEDSLDHISRRMNDVRRRLEHAQAGQQVVMLEDGVVESLDKLLEELEEARRRQQQQQSGGGQAPTQPMQDRVSGTSTTTALLRRSTSLPDNKLRSGWLATTPKRSRSRVIAVG
jgi:hypothetical protein